MKHKINLYQAFPRNYVIVLGILRLNKYRQGIGCCVFGGISVPNIISHIFATSRCEKARLLELHQNQMYLSLARLSIVLGWPFLCTFNNFSCSINIAIFNHCIRFLKMWKYSCFHCEHNTTHTTLKMRCVRLFMMYERCKICVAEIKESKSGNKGFLISLPKTLIGVKLIRRSFKNKKPPMKDRWLFLVLLWGGGVFN